MSGAPPPPAAASPSAACSSVKVRCRRRAPNSRLGVVPAAPTLPPLEVPGESSRRAPLAQQQSEERAALEKQFTDRVRAQKQQSDTLCLVQVVTAALDDNCAEQEQRSTQEDADDDAFALAGRLVRAIGAKCPHAAQLLSLLLCESHELVQSKLRSEAERSDWSKRVTCPLEPRSPERRSSSEEDVDSEDGSDNLDSQDDQEASMQASPRSPLQVNRRRFRTTLRSRRFPPTRVPESERVATKFAYTPFSHHHWGAVARGELRIDSEATSTSAARCDDSCSENGAHDAVGSPQWTVVLFPRARPSLSREEIGAFTMWALKTLDQLETGECYVDGSDLADGGNSNAATAAAARLLNQLAARELVAYELSRLVFDKCPTTARFLHGLFVELQELAARTLAAADKEARVLDQRHRNALLEQQKLKVRRETVESSLLALQDSMKRRQHQLLTERERIIRQRKKLNVLLAADQVVIRRVVGVLQHGIECADELLTAGRDKDESIVGSPSPRVSPTLSVASCFASYSAVQELVDLVATKYAALPEVQQAKREYYGDRKRQFCRDNGVDRTADTSVDSDDPAERQVIVLATEDVAAAADEFKAALGRLTRLLTTKCPDSGVGWAAEELWDQALFIPSPEDVQDVDRDIQRLCVHVEEFILYERKRRLLHLHDGRRIHSATQTDLTTCGPGFLRGRQRANAILSARVGLTAPSLMPNVDAESYPKGAESSAGSHSQPVTYRSGQQHSMAATPSKERVLGVTSNGQVYVVQSTETQLSTAIRLTLLRESNSELLSKFLPEGLRSFVCSIPVDYEPRQLSLTIVHIIISYIFNEMWALVQQENLQIMGANSTMRRFGSSASSSTPISVRSAHEYLYRIYLEHFQTPSFAVCRLLDLLVSTNRLDTQSCKVLLFCRLIGLPGTDPLPPDSFWFLLKALHVLQRACIGSGNYFLLDAHGVNEFVPQASAWEALNQLFHNAGNDVMKRLQMRLAGLASVFGAVWIPAYCVMEIVVEEWTLGQIALRSALEEAMFMQRNSAGGGGSSARDAIVTFAEFLGVFERLNLRVSRMEAAQAYQHLLSNAQQSRGNDQSSSCTANNGDAAALDLVRFNDQWLGLVLAAINRAQHQQYHNPHAYAASRRLSDTSSGDGTSASIYFGAPCEALTMANQGLSRRFLKATWEQTKPDFIRWLDLAFHDIGLQVRLIQQMDSICDSAELPIHHAWQGFQQLIQIVTLGSINP